MKNLFKKNKNKKQKFFIQKHYFLLLELIIVISIITISSLAIIRNPIFFFRSQIDTLIQVEYERISDLSLCDIKTKLYENSIKFEDLIKNKKDTKRQLLDPISIKIPTICTKKIYRSFRVWKKENKNGENSIQYSLLKVEIYLSTDSKITKKQKNVFTYRIFVQKQNV